MSYKEIAIDYVIGMDIPVHIQNNHVMNIATEKQLHNQVVSWIRRFHPELVIVPGLGELQKTDEARMEAWAKGYTKGQADLLILHINVDFAGLCFEFKSPLGSGTLSRHTGGIPVQDEEERILRDGVQRLRRDH